MQPNMHLTVEDIMKSVKNLFLVTLAVLLIPFTALAQSRTRPGPHAATYNSQLQIGPVPGFTTAWYPAPTETAVPLGVTLQFKAKGRRAGTVEWTGAREIGGRRGTSTAECRLDTPGPHTVTMAYTDQDGELRQESSLLSVIDTSVFPITLSTPRLWEDPVLVDESSSNETTMRYFFGDSIAAVRQISDGRYLTSSNRWFHLEVDVEPAGFAPLLEWRLNGKAQRHLGAAIMMQVFPPRQHAIEVGSPDKSQEITLEAYMVHINDKPGIDQISEHSPVTFTAVTDPPGYESEITWLASTKYGTCEPAMGRGREFTVTFRGTFGDDGRWMGVKADNTVFNADGKGTAPLGFITDLRPAVAQAMQAAAQDAGVTIDSEGMFFGSRGDVLVVNSAIASVEELTEEDFEQGADLMFSFISGDLAQDLELDPGFYTIRITGTGPQATGAFIDRNGDIEGIFPAAVEFMETPGDEPSRTLVNASPMELGLTLGGHVHGCVLGICGWVSVTITIGAAPFF